MWHFFFVVEPFPVRATELCPIKHVPKCTVPALFAAGADDGFVAPHHAEDLFNAHGANGTKQFVKFPGDHNSIREKWFLDRAMVFLKTGAYEIQRRPMPAFAGVIHRRSNAAIVCSLHCYV